MPAPIVFVTDFGSSDTYAAALAAACWRVDPGLTALAGMHGVPPGDVLAGAYHVKALARALPPGGVVCAVVDPGVGTERAALAVDAGGVLCVAPDNGLASYIWAEAELRGRRGVVLPVPAEAAATFHGRDVFAPAAARLATGASLDSLGRPLDGAPLRCDDAFARELDGVLHGVVCVVDHFGNAITTVRDSDLRGRDIAAVEWDGGGTVEVVRTYADAGAGLAALLGSAGHVEIAARGAPAEARGGPALHAAVRVRLRRGGEPAVAAAPA
jgi:S-adenosylmethionine hydrolase